MDGVLRPLPPALAKIAIEELNEDPAKIQEHLEELRNWTLQQSHLNARTDDSFLVIFLRGYKYDIEKAKSGLDFFYLCRTDAAEYFTNRDINEPRTKELLKVGAVLTLPKTIEEDGPRVLLLRPGIFNPSKYHIKEITKIGTIMSDILMNEDDNIIISGYIAVGDCSNLRPSHFFQFDPIFLRKMIKYFQDSSQAPIRGIHLVNLPFGFRSFLNFIKSFLNADFKNMIHVHASIDDLFKHIPKKYFPKEYGGETSTIPEILDDWLIQIEKFNKHLKEHEKYGVDKVKLKNRSNNKHHK